MYRGPHFALDRSSDIAFADPSRMVLAFRRTRWIRHANKPDLHRTHSGSEMESCASDCFLHADRTYMDSSCIGFSPLEMNSIDIRVEYWVLVTYLGHS